MINDVVPGGKESEKGLFELEWKTMEKERSTAKNGRTSKMLNGLRLGN